jgi:hypothetical protein
MIGLLIGSLSPPQPTIVNNLFFLSSKNELITFSTASGVWA